MLRIHAIWVRLCFEQGVQAQENEHNGNGEPQFATERPERTLALDEVAPQKQLDVANESHSSQLRHSARRWEKPTDKSYTLPVPLFRIQRNLNKKDPEGCNIGTLVQVNVHHPYLKYTVTDPSFTNI
jgi:hypothetical protein